MSTGCGVVDVGGGAVGSPRAPTSLITVTDLPGNENRGVNEIPDRVLLTGAIFVGLASELTAAGSPVITVCVPSSKRLTPLKDSFADCCWELKLTIFR